MSFYVWLLRTLTLSPIMQLWPTIGYQSVNLRSRTGLLKLTDNAQHAESCFRIFGS